MAQFQRGRAGWNGSTGTQTVMVNRLLIFNWIWIH